MKVLRVQRWLLLATLCGALQAQMSVTISASGGPTVPLGTAVTWTASVSGASPGTLAYRFRIRSTAGDFHTLVDYGPKPALTWTTIEAEGSYQMEVSVQNYDTGEQATADATQGFASLVTGSAPVITPSANPLVSIYSAPPCEPGARMRVQFEGPDGSMQSTPYKPCLSGSMNFYLAGMSPGARYNVQHKIEADRTVSLGPSVSLMTGGTTAVQPLPFSMVGQDPPSPGGLLLQSLFGQPSTATDLNGNLVWFSPSDITYLTQPVTGGTFLGIAEDPTQPVSHQFIREFDLAGITVAETNAAQVNQQLATLGFNPISGFHHDMRKLPGGGYLALAGTERILTNVQGPGPVDVIGDMILAFDQDLQVTWAWDAFDHLDPYRTATLGERCVYPASVACAPFYLSSTANDWLHGNAISLTDDGNILYSARHQDWIFKIDYASGNGNGEILWRMGLSGDFRMASAGLNPWFSHQHDPNFEMNGSILLVFDNGNVRQANDPTAHSRGQVLQVDETNRVVTPLLNVDLGVFSAALGTAELLPGGNYNFDAGFLLSQDANGSQLYSAISYQVEPTGAIDFGLQFGALEYRTFRMPDLYTSPHDALPRTAPHGRTTIR